MICTIATMWGRGLPLQMEAMVPMNLDNPGEMVARDDDDG